TCRGCRQSEGRPIKRDMPRLVFADYRWKSRPRGRPRLPPDLRQLIAEMAFANRTWGEERIAAELLVKLGIRVSPRTVTRFMRPRRPHTCKSRIPRRQAANGSGQDRGSRRPTVPGPDPQALVGDCR